MRAQHLLHRYAQATAAAAFGLLVAGGLVTSTDSGLAVPDGPLSYGTWFPPMVGGIRYEHGHRMIAGVVGLMILGLTLWLWRGGYRARGGRGGPVVAPAPRVHCPRLFGSIGVRPHGLSGVRDRAIICCARLDRSAHCRPRTGGGRRRGRTTPAGGDRAPPRCRRVVACGGRRP